MLFYFILGSRSDTCSSSDVHWIWITQEQMLDSVFLDRRIPPLLVHGNTIYCYKLAE